MCSIEAYEKLHPTCADSESSIGVILLPCCLLTDVLVSLVHTLDFIEIWLKSLERNYYKQPIIQRDNMRDVLIIFMLLFQNPIITVVLKIKI